MEFLTEELQETAMDYLNNDSTDIRFKIFKKKIIEIEAESDIKKHTAISLIGRAILALYYLNSGIDNMDEIERLVIYKDAKICELIKESYEESYEERRRENRTSRYFKILEAVAIKFY